MGKTKALAGRRGGSRRVFLMVGVVGWVLFPHVNMCLIYNVAQCSAVPFLVKCNVLSICFSSMPFSIVSTFQFYRHKNANVVILIPL